MLILDNSFLCRKTIHSLNKDDDALNMAARLHNQLGEDDALTNENASNKKKMKKRVNVLLLDNLMEIYDQI